LIGFGEECLIGKTLVMCMFGLDVFWLSMVILSIVPAGLLSLFIFWRDGKQNNDN
jgi:hypothetical protein